MLYDRLNRGFGYFIEDKILKILLGFYRMLRNLLVRGERQVILKDLFDLGLDI